MSENIELVQHVQESYFENENIPSPIGGDTNSIFFHLLSAIENIGINVNKGLTHLSNWLSTDVTWYTPFLRELMPIPYFTDDSDRQYLDRILFIQDMKFNQPQLTDMQKLSRVISHYVNSKSIGSYILPENATLYSHGEARYSWADPDDSDPQFWKSNTDDLADDDSYWGDQVDLDAYDSIVINVSDEEVDDVWWDFWTLPENYTKIIEFFKIFVPTHIFYEFKFNYTS